MARPSPGADRWQTALIWSLCAAPLLYLWGLGFADQLGPNPAEALIRGLGDWTLRFLCLTLLITPLRKTFGWTRLARSRRGLGLWTFAYACNHLLAYAWLDMGWDLDDLLQDLQRRPFIWVGMSALGLMLPLALTSFNRAIKTLGAPRWQALHRLVYLVAVGAVLHFNWMRAGKNHFGEVHMYAAVLGGLMLWRIALWWRARSQRFTS